MSTIIKVRCTDQIMTFEHTPLIASGGLEEDFVQFAFCSKWDGLVKTAVFWRNEKEVYHQLLDEADTCPIPPEVLTDEGVIWFGVFGVSTEGKQRTSEALTYTIVQGAITTDTKPSDPTPDIYTQIMAEFLRFENEITEKVDTFTENMSTAWAEYQTALAQQLTEYNAAMVARQEEYEQSVNEQWKNFKEGGDFVLKTTYAEDKEAHDTEYAAYKQAQTEAVQALQKSVDDMGTTQGDLSAVMAALGFDNIDTFAEALLAAPGPVKIASYETAGSFTWTAPDLANGKAYKIGVLIIGAGGSGGVTGAHSSGSYFRYCTGGGSGCSLHIVLTISPGETKNGVVGKGGAAVSANGSTLLEGESGGSSAFGGATAPGGNGGVVGNDSTTTGAKEPYCEGSQLGTVINSAFGLNLVDIPEKSKTISAQCINLFENKPILAGGAGAYADKNKANAGVAVFSGGKDPVTEKGGGNGAGNSAGNATAESATDAGCGGGGAAIAYSTSYTAKSGAGADGAVYIYFLGVAD